MNLLKTGITCLLLSLCAMSATAQTPDLTKNSRVAKPQLFSDLPPHIALNAVSFPQLLQKNIGEKISLPLAPGVIFQGVVVSKSDASDVRSKTVVIKSSNRQGAALTITGIQKKDGNYRYSGRMLSLKHSDAYEMVEQDGRFALQKTALNELVTE